MNVEKAIKHILQGLYTDGAHHKQYDLEMALEALTGKTVESYIREIEGEEHIEVYGLPEEGIP